MALTMLLHRWFDHLFAYTQVSATYIHGRTTNITVGAQNSLLNLGSTPIQIPNMNVINPFMMCVPYVYILHVMKQLATGSDGGDI